MGLTRKKFILTFMKKNKLLAITYHSAIRNAFSLVPPTLQVWLKLQHCELCGCGIFRSRMHVCVGRIVPSIPVVTSWM